ncbi:MAG: hypothetical protein AAF212_03275 [Verrucomicrobiota bacterium]
MSLLLRFLVVPLLALTSLSLSSVKAVLLEDDFSSGRLLENWFANPFSFLSPKTSEFSVFNNALHYTSFSGQEDTPSDTVLISTKTVTLDRAWTVSTTLRLFNLEPPIEAGVYRKYGICLGVANLSNHFESVDVGIRWNRPSMSYAVREAYSNFDTKNSRTPGNVVLIDFGESVNFVEYEVSIEYDPTTTLIYTYIDDSVNKFLMGSFNPFNEWGVAASQRLVVGIRGFSNRVDVSTTNQVIADNFVIEIPDDDGTSAFQSEVSIEPAQAVQLDTVEGATYQLELSEDLEFWFPIGDPFVGDGRSYQYLDAIGDVERRFYRFKMISLH